MEARRYTLSLSDYSYNTIRINQYDKNYSFEFELENYDYSLGDMAKIEWVVNNQLFLIQSGNDVVLNENIVTCNLRKEITQMSGIGYFNLVIFNVDTETRIATFKSQFEIIGNSVSDDTTSSGMINTLMEEMTEKENNCKKTMEDLQDTINSGNLSLYELKADNYNKVATDEKFLSKESASETYVTQTDLQDNYTPTVSLENKYFTKEQSNEKYVNKTWFEAYGVTNTVLYKDEKSIIKNKIRDYIQDDTESVLLNKMVDMMLPVGIVIGYINETNPNALYPNTTWVRVAQAKQIVGVGTATDKWGTKKTFVAEYPNNDTNNNNRGLYEQALTSVNQIPSHTHAQKVTNKLASGGTSGRNDYSSEGNSGVYSQGVETYATGYTNATTGRSQPFGITEPSYGIYFWKRTE